MARYQVRTPDYLEDIITRLAEQSWKTLRIWNVLESDVSYEDYLLFRTAMRDAIALRLRTYKLCGLSNICTDHLQSTPWAPQSNVLDANPYDRIYHLFPVTDLDGFLVEVTSKTITAITKILKPDHEKEAHSMLSAVLKLILGQYLYVDPICGKTELCFYSSSAPRNIWKKANVRGELLEEGT